MEILVPELLQYGVGGAALALGVWIGRALGMVDSRLGAVESEMRSVRAEVHALSARSR